MCSPTRDGKRETSDLTDGLGGAGKKIRSIVDEPTRPVHHARFLVGEEHDNDVTSGSLSGSTPVAHHRRDHRVHVLHVHGASAPDETVVDFCREWRMGPITRHSWHNI
jgi:hypothetical protein